MPKMPTQEEMDLHKIALDPVAVVNAIINDMHDRELEQSLVDAGVAVFVSDNKE